MPAVTCPRCDRPLTWGTVWAGGVVEGACVSCETPLHGRVFPQVAAPEVAGAESVAPPGAGAAAVCYNHDAKPAVSACDQCGRFLCALCELSVEGRTYCPSCFGRMDSQGRIQTLKHHETRHDSVALAMSVLPLLLWPFTIITAPLTIVYICKYWSTPRQSIQPRLRWRFYLAALFALALCAAWIWLFYFILRRVVRD